MRNLIFLTLAALAVAFVPAATGHASKTVTVSITRTSFVPKDVTVQVNDAITWTNMDTANHQVTCQTCPFSSPILKPGETFSRTFTKAGKFAIQDPLNNRIKGTVTVTAAAPPPSVTLAASPTIVVYGGSSTVSGKLPGAPAGEKVTILAQECGLTAFKPVTTVDTTAGGTFSAGVKPLKNTLYQAKSKSSTSPQVAVKVRPRLILGKIAPHKYRLRVRAAQSFAGKTAVFQRFNAVTSRWVRVRLVVLKDIGTGIAPTKVSGATFRSSIRAGLRVRVVIGQAQVGSCYLAGRSNVIRS